MAYPKSTPQLCLKDPGAVDETAMSAANKLALQRMELYHEDSRVANSVTKPASSSRKSKAQRLALWSKIMISILWNPIFNLTNYPFVTFGHRASRPTKTEKRLPVVFGERRLLRKMNLEPGTLNTFSWWIRGQLIFLNMLSASWNNDSK